MRSVVRALGLMLLGVVLGWQVCAWRGAVAVREAERAVRALDVRVVERGKRVRALEAEAESLRIVLDETAAVALEWEMAASALWRRLDSIEQRRDDEDDERGGALVDSMASRLCASVGARC